MEEPSSPAGVERLAMSKYSPAIMSLHALQVMRSGVVMGTTSRSPTVGSSQALRRSSPMRCAMRSMCLSFL